MLRLMNNKILARLNQVNRSLTSSCYPTITPRRQQGNIRTLSFILHYK